MRYPLPFFLLALIFSISGVMISLMNNDIIADNTNNYVKQINNTNANEKNINDKLKENEEKFKKSEEERRKKIQDEIKNILSEDDDNKEDKEKKKKEEEKKKKEEEEKRRREEEEKKKKEEEKKKKEEEKKKKEEEKKKKEEEKKKKEKDGNNKKENDRNNKQEEILSKIQDKSIYKFTEDGKIRIACAYALDNTYVYPTLVAMTSLTENAAKKTFYDIYVMIGTGFTDENRKVILSVQEKHPEHCEIHFIDMANKFSTFESNKKITTPTYYRLELPNLLPNVNRIIWMDGDTAVFEDLTELITLDMKHYYIMGFLDSLPNAIERFGVKDATVLCAGVLLFDLDALRKNHMQEKFYEFMNANKGKLNQHDQTVINVVCQNNIGPLPPKYGIWCFEAEIYALKHNERQRAWLKYDKKEFLDAYYHPAILHYVWPKPFWKRQRPVFNKEWWEYAKKSGYYNEVYNKSPKWISNRLLTELIYEKNIYPYFY